MTVDVHARCWPAGSFSDAFIAVELRMRAGAADPSTPYDRYVEHQPPDEEVASIAFGGKGRGAFALAGPEGSRESLKGRRFA